MNLPGARSSIKRTWRASWYSWRRLGIARAAEMDSFFDKALLLARRLGASDVHLKPGLSPILRIAGELRTLSDVPPLSREFIHSLVLSMLNDRRRELFERNGDVGMSLTTGEGGRQRVQIWQHRGGVA